MLVEAQLQRGGLLLVQVLDDEAQRIAVEAQLCLLVGRKLGVGGRDQGRARRVERVRTAPLGRVGGATPGDLLQQRPAVLDRLAPRFQREQLCPCFLVDLLRVFETREVGAHHPDHGRAVLRVVAFDLGGARRGKGASRGHVDDQRMAAALSVDELRQTPYLQLVARVYQEARRLNPRAPVLRPSSDRSCAISPLGGPVCSSLPAGALSRAFMQRRGPPHLGTCPHASGAGSRGSAVDAEALGVFETHQRLAPRRRVAHRVA